MIGNIFGWTPSFETFSTVNLIEKENELVMEFRAAGLTKEDISIEFNAESGSLKIRGRKTEQEDLQENNYTRREFWADRIYRDFELPSCYRNPENIKSVLSNGILTVTIQKMPKEKNVVNIGTIELS